MSIFVLQGIENVQKELEAQYTQQMADMEHKLNDARREHTKAGRHTQQNYISLCIKNPRDLCVI